MRYVTIKELSDIIRKNLWKIPHDIDVVVGIPRSGMLAANMIALYLNTNLSDIDSFVDGKVFRNGLSRGCFVRKNDMIRKILVVDDSIDRGTAMTNAKSKLKDIHYKDIEVLYCAPIATSFGSTMADICFEIIDDDRVFEWNLFHHRILENACVDIDGVLCLNPKEDDDGVKYREFLNSANPLFTPTVTINTLISCRLEKYRVQTEKWLKDNNIRYKKLILLDLPDKASRIKWGKHGEYKGAYYKESDCCLFIESSQHEAATIARCSNKPVICVETNELLLLPLETRLIKEKKKIRKHMPRAYQLLKCLKK